MVSFVSIPSNGSIQFLPPIIDRAVSFIKTLSQSPQTGQFNSYRNERRDDCKRLENVSIPSNGSIQFLHSLHPFVVYAVAILVSQSPQTGQFNSYGILIKRFQKLSYRSLNPLKRVNSILTQGWALPEFGAILVSIPSNGSIQFLQ